MGGFIARRLLAALLVVWGALTVIFLIVRVLPGDPAAVLLGTYATPQLIAEQRERLGLNRPRAVQYVLFMRQAVLGDWGRSYYEGSGAMGLVLARVPATTELAAASLTLSVAASFVLGSVAARWAHSVLDRLIETLSLVAQAAPNFWLGLVAILIFSRDLKWLPSFGRGGLWHLVLPAVTLSMQFIGLLTRLTRAGILEMAGQDFARTARAKGLPETGVLVRHIYRNMLIPVVTMIGLQLGTLVGGVVVTETVFAWPGLGRLIVTAIENRDYPLVQAAVVFTAVVFVLSNLAADVAYACLDPRIRYQ
ncbi:MAG TPA: ABC transporter permease [bacterium]|nr:ABC transporter permease [bacterium]